MRIFRIFSIFNISSNIDNADQKKELKKILEEKGYSEQQVSLGIAAFDWVEAGSYIKRKLVAKMINENAEKYGEKMNLYYTAMLLDEDIAHVLIKTKWKASKAHEKAVALLKK